MWAYAWSVQTFVLLMPCPRCSTVNMHVPEMVTPDKTISTYVGNTTSFDSVWLGARVPSIKSLKFIGTYTERSGACDFPLGSVVTVGTLRAVSDIRSKVREADRRTEMIVRVVV